MSYPLEKYKFFIDTKKNKVIAVSRYAGKTVKGTATCHPDDVFDLELGKKIAAARCNEKVAEKRLARASSKAYAATLEVTHAQTKQQKMAKYAQDAFLAYNQAAQETDALINSIKSHN